MEEVSEEARNIIDECWRSSKKGWVLVTKITGDVLSEALMVLLLIKKFGKVLYRESFIPQNLRDLKGLAIYLNGEVYISKDVFLTLHKIIENNPNYMIERLINMNYHYYEELLKNAKKLNKEFEKRLKSGSMSKDEIYSFYNSFLNMFSDALVLVDSPFYIEYSIKRLIRKRLRNRDKETVENLISLYGWSKKVTTVGKEKEDFNRLINIAKENKELCNLLKSNKKNKIILSYLSKNYPDFYKKLERHTHKYSFLGIRFFGGSPYKIKDFLKKLRISLNNVEKSEIERKSEKRTNSLLKEKREVDDLLSLLQEASYMRTWRLETLNKSIFYIRSLLERIAKATELNYYDLIYLTPDEIENLLIEKKRKSDVIDIIQRRKRGFGVIFDKRYNLYIITGNDLKYAKDYFFTHLHKKEEKLNEIRGTVAFPGYVKGKVSIIHNAHELKKFKKGRILVTPMTTPDFAPIIDKALAIITDIGGITSHAAIISRELKKPCIIGTKIATKVLKDGNLVEVDGKNGIVKIIERR